MRTFYFIFPFGVILIPQLMTVIVLITISCGLRYARSRAKKDGSAPGPGQGRKKKVEKSDEKLNHHHLVGGVGSSNGVEIKREARQKNKDGAGGTMTPPLSTIAAAGGSPGYASSMLRRSYGSGSEYGAPGTSPSGSINGNEGGQHGHAHYAVLASGNGAANVGGETGNGSVLTPSPSPPASASTSVPSASASGSLDLPLPGASPSNAPTSASSLPQSEFIHYHPPAQHQQHDRVIPPLALHPHPQTSHSPQSSNGHQHTHPYSPLATFSSHPSGSGGHYVHAGYTTRPSPLSQTGNIVTGHAAGPFTPLSVPPSATEATDSGPGGGTGLGAGHGMQLPPLAYMDRMVGSNPNNGHMVHGGLLGSIGIKLEYGDEQNHMQNGGGGIGGSSVGREPLTPLSAESPIGPGVLGRSGRRSVL